MEDGEYSLLYLSKGCHCFQLFNVLDTRKGWVVDSFACYSNLNLSIQLLPSVLVLLPGFTGGAAISYGAVALPFYMDPDNDSGLVMTKDQATWFSKC